MNQSAESQVRLMNGNIYPPSETEPVRARLLELRMCEDLAAEWVGRAVEEGYRQDETVSRESASDLVGFGILTLESLKSLAEGEPWTHNHAPPSAWNDLIDIVDEKRRKQERLRQEFEAIRTGQES